MIDYSIQPYDGKLYLWHDHLYRVVSTYDDGDCDLEDLYGTHVSCVSESELELFTGKEVQVCQV